MTLLRTSRKLSWQCSIESARPPAALRSLADPRRAVLTQMRYVADVASNLPSKAYSTSGRLPTGVAAMEGTGTDSQARTVFLFVPPVAACLKIPVAARRRPELASILLSEQHPSAWCYLAAKWQLDVAYREAPVSATGFWTGFRTLFLGPTQRLFLPSRGPTSLRTFPTHWFSRLKQLLCV